MEIKIGTKQILKVLQVLSWIIFIALCVEAGGILFNAIYALYKPGVAKYFWKGANLEALFAYDKGHFISQIFLMLIVAVMKGLIFYLIIKLFKNKDLSISKPFEAGVIAAVFKIGYLCLGAGLFSSWGRKQAAWFTSKGISMPDTESMGIGGADIWFFMAVILFVIGQVFKKGAALQTENDLTV